MIVVAGATGLVGRAAIEVLQSGRRPITELSLRPRDPAFDDGSRVRVACDVTDAAALARSIPRARSIVHLAGVAPGMKPVRADHEIAAMRALLELARARSSERFIFLSAIGAAPDASHPWLRAKGEAEQLLRASGVPSVVLRAGLVTSEEAPALNALMQVVRAGVPLRRPLLRAGRILPIAAGDVAIAIATALDHHKMVGESIDLGTPPDLSLDDLLALITGRLRAELTIRRLPFTGHPLAAALAQVPIAPLTDAEGFVRLFAVLEPQSVAVHDRLIPMKRVPLADDLRGYPWGVPPPRPGDPLPTMQPEPATALPLIIPGSGRGEPGASPGAASPSQFGRTDPFGRVERAERSPHAESGDEGKSC